MEVSGLMQFARQSFIKQPRYQFELAVDTILAIPGRNLRDLCLIAGAHSFDAIEQRQRNTSRHQRHAAVAEGMEGDAERITGIALDNLQPGNRVSGFGGDGAADKFEGGRQAGLGEQKRPPDGKLTRR